MSRRTSRDARPAATGLQQAILNQWFFKVAYEILATPLTYLVVNWLKRSEDIDYYDRDTDFSPLHVNN